MPRWQSGLAARRLKYLGFMSFRGPLLLVIGLSLCFLPLIRGQGHQAATTQSPDGGGEAEAVERGKTVFRSNCGFCHGEDATGSRAPDLLHSTTLSHDENGNLIKPVIRNGRLDKGMPAFSALKDTQIADIVAFLHRQAYEAAHNANVPGNYPLSKLLTGNAQAGKAFFEGAGGCSGCHAVKDMAGAVKRYAPVDLQQRLVYPENDSAIRTATVTTGEGKQYQGAVKELDEFTIAIVCQDGWYRSWPLDRVKVDMKDPMAAHRELTTKLTDAEMHNLFAYLESMK